MVTNKKLSRSEFFELLKDESRPKMATSGRADWDAIYKALKQTNEPLSIKVIWEEYVKGAVSRFRTKNVLQGWAAEDKCRMIWYKGQYWFYFGRKPRTRTKKAKAPKVQK